MVESLPLMNLYTKLREEFGFRDWWPADAKDEIIIGAILTQQTSWANVKKALYNLKKNRMLSLKKISKTDLAHLEKLVRSSGFYRQKAKRLKGFASYVFDNYGSLGKFFDKSSDELRKELLGLDGIGQETADVIMLYAAEKPEFVIDAYTKRIMSRIYDGEESVDYQELQAVITARIPKNVELYKDFHAQFDELGKEYCRTRPLCDKCPVRPYCNYYIYQKRT